jgi:hypothetical protein
MLLETTALEGVVLTVQDTQELKEQAVPLAGLELPPDFEQEAHEVLSLTLIQGPKP